MSDPILVPVQVPVNSDSNKLRSGGVLVVAALVIGLFIGGAAAGLIAEGKVSAAEEGASDLALELDDANSDIADCQDIEQDLRSVALGLDDVYVRALELAIRAINREDIVVSSTRTSVQYDEIRAHYQSVGSCG